MRMLPLAVLAMVFGWSTGAGATPYSVAVMADNPVSYWRFEETSGTTAVDAMGANNGTYVGTPQFNQGGPSNPPYVGMVGDQSVGLDNEWIDLGTNPSLRLDQTSFTLEAWVKPNGLGQSNDCLGPGGTCDNLFFQAGNASGAGVQKSVSWRIWQAHGGQTGHLQLEFYGVGGFPDPNQGQIEPGLIVELGVWTHLAVSYDMATGLGSFYNNGVETFSHTYGAGLSYDYFAGTQIGAEYLVGSVYHNADYEGSLSDLALYNKVLNAGQVQAHYLAAVPEPSTALLLGLGLVGLAARKRV